MALKTDSETFVMHIAILEQKKMPVYSEKQAQIKAQSGTQVETLIFDKVLTSVMAKHSNYSNVFSTEYIAGLSKHTGINDHIIELEEVKQPLFGLIYNLGPIKLEILKIYIKTNLVNGFIRLFKSPVRVPILFDKKPDRNFYFCIDYKDLYNLTIKNRYPLTLISKLLK